MTTLTVATRKSRLALWQSEHVAETLRRLDPRLEVRLLPMSTRGDEMLDRSLSEIGGKGLFLKELERALVEGSADLAVHSLKDVPAEEPEGLILGAWLPRANPRDYWIAGDRGGIDGLASGARVGSSSLRRISQLRARRPDLEIVPLRGNVETRLAAVADGRVDATILAAAGLERLGIVPEGAVALPLAEWLPAPGQGIIAVQQRAGDERLAALLEQISCPHAAAQARAEREVVRLLGGDCTMPLAVHARIECDRMHVRARLGDGEGGMIEADAAGDLTNASRLGRETADRLFAAGAREVLETLNLSQN